MNRTAARIAIALLAFVLGIVTSSLWNLYRTPPRTPAPVNPTPAAINEPVTTPITPAPDRAVVFGGLKLVSNQVQLEHEFLRYKVNVIYPQIDGSDALFIRKLNNNIEQLAIKQYQWLLEPSREDLRYYKHGPHPEVFNSVNLDYEVVLATDSFLSIYFEGFSYGIGAAHSVHYSFVVNYDLASRRQLKLSDIFRPGSKYLKLISELCIKELSQGKDGEFLSKNELAPVAANFESWNITREGIRFNFDACEVLSCADGKQTVLIPYTAFKSIERGGIRKLVWNK